MYKIIKAEKLNEIVYLMVVEAPMVAKHCQPGQFIIVKEDDAGERIPLTICDYDREAGNNCIPANRSIYRKICKTPGRRFI